jgi:Domain of unknown function (DUF5063)
VPGGGNPVAAFRAAAERYAAVIETAEGRPPEQLLARLIGVLPVLYEAALRLPDVRLETIKLPNRARLSQEPWEVVYERLRAVLGSSDHFWKVEAFGGNESEHPGGSLADDLADIYGEVKEGLNHLAAGESEIEVVWQWRDTFWGHWGQHAVGALLVIHAQLAAGLGPGSDPNEE